MSSHSCSNLSPKHSDKACYLNYTDAELIQPFYTALLTRISELHCNENTGSLQVNVQFVLSFNSACKMLAEVQAMDKKKKNNFLPIQNQRSMTWKTIF